MRLGQAESGALDALVLPEPSARRIAERGVRDDELVRRECAGIVVVYRWPRAEKRDLKAERSSRGGCEPSGDIPPFGSKQRMAAVILGEAQRPHAVDLAVACRRGNPARGARDRRDRDGANDDGCRTARGDRGRGRGAPPAPRGPPRARSGHQSSRTARTASWLIAARPLQIAVSAAAAIITRLTSASCHTGTARSMLQLNDCRSITNTSTRLSAPPSTTP